MFFSSVLINSLMSLPIWFMKSIGHQYLIKLSTIFGQI